MPTALVTGASSGIGAAFARRLSADGYDVVAVARRQDRLEQLLAEGGATEIIVADLSSAEGCGAVEARIAAGGIDLLINNAGIGVGAGFDETPIEAEEGMLALNVRAVMRLTHVAVPLMLKAGRGEIINVSSVAAFTAVAGFATYSASKAYVVALSESLAVRYSSHGVTVMALCPGYVRSEMHERSEMPSSGLQARLLWWNADALVDVALRDLRRGRVICLPGLPYKASVAATKLLPRRAIAGLAKFANRDQQ